MHELLTRLLKPSVRLSASLAVLAITLAVPCAMSAEPIRIGVTASLSGRFVAPGSDMLAGIEMWAHDVNTRGALLGRRVEIVHYDDESDPQKSAAQYERLLKEDGVDLLLGPYGSTITYVASSVAERHSVPMVSGSASASEIWARGYQNVFQVDARAKDYPDLLIQSAADAGLTRLALLHEDTTFTNEVAEGAREEAAKHGLTVVFDEAYRDLHDVSGLVQRLGRAEPDVFLGGTYFEDAIALVQEAKKQGFAPKAIAFTVGPALAEFGDALGTDAEGILGLTPWMRSAAVPMAYDFSFRYKGKYGRNPSYQAAYGYASGQVLEAAVRLAGSLDNDAVHHQLGSMRFKSLMGHYRVDETGAQLDKETLVMQWQDGRRVLVLPKEVREAAVEYPFTPWSER